MASRQFESDEREGIVGLVRETIDGLRTLIADHIKLARIELETDLKTYARGAACKGCKLRDVCPAPLDGPAR